MSARKAKAAPAVAADQPEFAGYILRTCAADMTSHGGFVWPEAGHVAAPDFGPAIDDTVASARFHGFRCVRVAA